VFEQVRAEGHEQVLRTAAALLIALEQSDAADLLPALVTPVSLTAMDAHDKAFGV
jgi:hypothetical protein